MAVTRDAKAVDSRFMAYGIPLRHAPLAGVSDFASLWITARLLKSLKRNRAVVHVHRYSDAFAVLLAKRLIHRPDIRVVATCHRVQAAHDTPVFRRMCAKTDAHIFVSQTARDAFLAPWNAKGNSPIPESRIHLLHNSLNLEENRPVAAPTRGPVTAICHGTIVAGKGFETVINALSTLRDIKLRLRIAGNGNPDYIDTLRRRAMARGVMELIDWVIPPGDISLLIGESHFGVQASARREAFALESLRYMAAGRPQVCVPNGAQSEYLTNEVSALFAPPADATKLADAMRRLATDPDLRNTLGENARRKYLRSLDWPHFINSLDKIYNP